MRTSRTATVRRPHTDRERNALRQIPLPRRRHLALEAENAKVNAQMAARISWIH